MKERKNIPEIRFEGFEGEWEEKRIGELGDIVTGSTPSTQEPLYYSNYGIPWVTPTDITDNITYHTAKYLSEKGKQVSRLVPENSILVTCIASIGKNTMLGTLGSFNQQINGLIPDENKYNTYFLYTESALWSNEMKRSAASGTMQIVNKKEFSELKTFIPTIEEQSLIGFYFQKLDKQITLEQQKHDKLVTLKKAMLEKMFPKEGASVPEIRFEGFEGEWKEKKMSEVADFSKGHSYSKNDIVEVGTPIILYGRLYTKYQLTISEVDTFVVEKPGSIYSTGNEVIVPASGETAEDIAIGSAILVPGIIFGGDLNIIYPNSTIDSQFLALSISHGKQHKELSKKAQGKSIVHLRNADIMQTTLNYPSKKEQSQIGSYFQYLDKLISLHQQKIDKLKNIKKACLEKMFV